MTVLSKSIAVGKTILAGAGLAGICACGSGQTTDNQQRPAPSSSITEGDTYHSTLVYCYDSDNTLNTAITMRLDEKPPELGTDHEHIPDDTGIEETPDYTDEVYHTGTDTMNVEEVKKTLIGLICTQGQETHKYIIDLSANSPNISDPIKTSPTPYGSISTNEEGSTLTIITNQPDFDRNKFAAIWGPLLFKVKTR